MTPPSIERLKDAPSVAISCQQDEQQECAYVVTLAETITASQQKEQQQLSDIVSPSRKHGNHLQESDICFAESGSLFISLHIIDMSLIMLQMGENKGSS